MYTVVHESRKQAVNGCIYTFVHEAEAVDTRMYSTSLTHDKEVDRGVDRGRQLTGTELWDLPTGRHPTRAADDLSAAYTRKG